MRFLLITFCSVFFVLPSYADEMPLQDKLLSLEGNWRGELGYIDYQSGERQAIGQAVVMRSTPDGAFLISEGRFTDPGFDVYILTISTMNATDRVLLESFHRDGAIETETFRIVSETSNKNGWQLVLIAQGKDDDRPATIRRTLTYEGETLTRKKEVDFLDDEKSGFVFRNETILKRSTDPVTFDDFRK